MVSIVIFGILDELLELAAPSLTSGPHWVFRMREAWEAVLFCDCHLSQGPKLSHWRSVCVQCGPGTSMPLPLWLLLYEEDLGSGSRNGPAHLWLLAISSGSGRKGWNGRTRDETHTWVQTAGPRVSFCPPCHVVSAVNPSAPYEHSHFSLEYSQLQ